MAVSAWRITLLALIALALLVSALLSTSAAASDDVRAVTAAGALR